MIKLKILLLENHLLAQHILVKMLTSLGHQSIYAASTAQEAITLLKREKSFDLLICSISADHANEIHFIREANHIGRINALLLISEIEQSTRHAIQQLARLSHYQPIGDLSKPVCKVKLFESLSSYRKQSFQKPLVLTEMFSADEIKMGLQLNQFMPYYQPKFDLKTNSIIGVEALARWKHPLLGIISPAAFIDVARHFGYLDDILQVVSKKALDFIKTNQCAEKLTVSVNIDSSQLRSPSLYKKIKQTLANSKICASQVTLEITEEGAIDASINCLENLINLRQLGCGISIDDFGAGYSSLQRICDLPCTEIKLDMSFTKNLMHNVKIESAIRNMVKFSQEIGAQLVVEGIEQEEQLNLLRKLGCNVGQGYLFSPPVPGEKLTSMLTEEKSKFQKTH